MRELALSLLPQNIENDIKFFNNYLNSFDWGYPDENGNNIVDIDDFKNYHLLSSYEFLKYQLGTCWDYTNFEVEWFMQKGFAHVCAPLKNGEICCFYIESEDKSNHSWLSYALHNKIYIFESSWKDYAGIHEFDSENEMLSCYSDCFQNDENYKAAKIWRYTRFPCSRMLPYDFMEKIKERGKLVFEKDYKKE